VEGGVGPGEVLVPAFAFKAVPWGACDAKPYAFTRLTLAQGR
jgi:hypothetical protein